MFYPEKFIATDHVVALRAGLSAHLQQGFRALDEHAAQQPDWLGAQTPSLLDFYVAALARWARLYPATGNTGWFDLAHYPALARLCARVEMLPCTAALQMAEGLGKTPFTAPQYPAPPEGSAT